MNIVIAVFNAHCLATAFACERGRRNGLIVTRLYAAMSLFLFGSAVWAFLLDEFAFTGTCAGQGALYGWLWWNSGGGDNTKRRLKSWASRFQGVRRTAPSHA